MIGNTDCTLRGFFSRFVYFEVCKENYRKNKNCKNNHNISMCLLYKLSLIEFLKTTISKISFYNL